MDGWEETIPDSDSLLQLMLSIRHNGSTDDQVTNFASATDAAPSTSV